MAAEAGLAPTEGELVAFGLLMERAERELAAARARIAGLESQLAALADSTGTLVRNAGEGERRRAEVAEARIAEYENAVTRGTSCLSCARILNSAAEETFRRERAEEKLAAIGEHVRGFATATAWTAEEIARLACVGADGSAVRALPRDAGGKREGCQVPEVPEERALASGEAAAALGIRVPVLLRLEAEGRITAFRTPGGTRRYPGAAVEVLRRELEAETAGLLTGVEVTSVLGVTSRTVGRYAATGKLTPVPGPGRTNWFRESEVRALLRGDRPEP